MTAAIAALAVLLALGLGVPAVAAAQTREHDSPADVDELKGDVVLYVDGMTCPFCSYGLEKKLTRLEAIEHIQIDLDKGRVVLTLREGESVTDEELEKAVDDAGFSLRSIERPADNAD